jgi:ornithine carbamoyltransferase
MKGTATMEAATTTIPELTDLLRISDLDPEGLRKLLDTAARMKAHPHGSRHAEVGRILACLFSKPSTRTRVSLEAAAWRLGMLPMMLRPDELQLGRGEPIADTARVLSSYVDILAIRTFSHAQVEELAAEATIPVINALTDEHHPCQALADLLTLRERFGSLEGLKVAYVGDGNNVAHSLMEAAALAGMEVAVATPAGYEPDADVVARAQELCAAGGGKVAVGGDPYLAAAGAHAVYTDVWVSMGDAEDERHDRIEALTPYAVTPALMAAARDDAVFLHCLPAHRGEEVAAEVIDGTQSWVFRQAANRLPTEQAVIDTLLWNARVACAL